MANIDMEATLDSEAFTRVASAYDAQERIVFTNRVERLQRLADHASTISEFLTEFGQLAADLFAASSLAIWFPESASELRLTSPKVAIGWSNLRLDDATEQAHRALIEYALHQDDPLSVQPFSCPHPRSEVANPTDAFLLLTSVTSQQQRLAVLEIALGPKPLRRPQRALIASYVAWLEFLGQVLGRGIQQTFARTATPGQSAMEVVCASRQQAERVKESLRADLQASLRQLAGQNFGSLRDNRQVVQQIHSLLESVGLRVRCRECGEPAILRCQNAGNSKTGAFVYDHYLDSGRTFHGGQTTFPQLTLVAKPARRRKASTES